MDSRNGHLRPHWTLQPNVPIDDLFSLSQPRPETDRFSNEYVDSPNKLAKKRQQLAQANHEKKQTGLLLSSEAKTAAFTTLDHFATTKKEPFSTDHFLTKQPHLLDTNSIQLKKAASCAIHGTHHRQGHSGQEDEKSWKQSSMSSQLPLDIRKNERPVGIICPECGECRCSACLSPRHLPKTWICNDRVEISANSIVDALSCMCLVESAIYHCTHYRANDDVVKDDRDGDPCSCSGSHCFPIWSCMSVAAFTCLPCLLCYWPMRVAVDSCAKCYASGSRRGCHCRKPSLTPLNSVVRLPSTSSADSSPVTSVRSLKDTPPPRPPKPGYAIRINPQNAENNGAFSRNRDFR